MAKRKQRFEIGCEEFVLENKTTVIPPLADIDDCYARPSATKCDIFDYWERWAREQGAHDYGVESYNCNFFTFGAVLTINNELYYAQVTYANHRLFKVACR